MPSGSGENEPRVPLPPELERDRAEFRAALARESERRSPGDPIAAALQDPRALSLWDRLAALVFSQSARLALVAEGDRSRIHTRHILDSLNPLELLPPASCSVLDIGSGAGFPGIPLAIARPDAAVTLLEAREKKVGFLERAIRDLELTNLTAVSARLEEYGEGGRGIQADVVTIRAIGGLATLLEHATPAARPGARWIYFLGSSDRAEALLRALDPETFHPGVDRGIFGGTLLTGSFPAGA